MASHDCSEPTIICKTCQLERSCLRHTRAEFPPDAAWRWVKKHCPRGGASCTRSYRAGVVFAKTKKHGENGLCQ